MLDEQKRRRAAAELADRLIELEHQASNLVIRPRRDPYAVVPIGQSALREDARQLGEPTIPQEEASQLPPAGEYIDRLLAAMPTPTIEGPTGETLYMPSDDRGKTELGRQRLFLSSIRDNPSLTEEQRWKLIKSQGFSPNLPPRTGALPPSPEAAPGTTQTSQEEIWPHRRAYTDVFPDVPGTTKGEQRMVQWLAGIGENVVQPTAQLANAAFTGLEGVTRPLRTIGEDIETFRAQNPPEDRKEAVIQGLLGGGGQATSMFLPGPKVLGAKIGAGIGGALTPYGLGRLPGAIAGWTAGGEIPAALSGDTTVSEAAKQSALSPIEFAKTIKNMPEAIARGLKADATPEELAGLRDTIDFAGMMAALHTISKAKAAKKAQGGEPPKPEVVAPLEVPPSTGAVKPAGPPEPPTAETKPGGTPMLPYNQVTALKTQLADIEARLAEKSAAALPPGARAGLEQAKREIETTLRQPEAATGPGGAVETESPEIVAKIEEVKQLDSLIETQGPANPPYIRQKWQNSRDQALAELDAMREKEAEVQEAKAQAEAEVEEAPPVVAEAKPEVEPTGVPSRAEAVPSVETKVREEPGGGDLRGQGQEQGGEKPPGEGAAPQVGVPNEARGGVADQVRPVAGGAVDAAQAGVGARPIPAVVEETRPTAAPPAPGVVGGVKAVKIGDNHRVMGTDMTVADVRTVDGVSYELYNGASLKEKKAAVRVIDQDSGEVVSLNSYPDFDRAEAAYNEAITKVGEKVRTTAAQGEAKQPLVSERKPVWDMTQDEARKFYEDWQQHFDKAEGGVVASLWKKGRPTGESGTLRVVTAKQLHNAVEKFQRAFGSLEVMVATLAKHSSWDWGISEAPLGQFFISKRDGFQFMRRSGVERAAQRGQFGEGIKDYPDLMKQYGREAKTALPYEQSVEQYAGPKPKDATPEEAALYESSVQEHARLVEQAAKSGAEIKPEILAEHPEVAAKLGKPIPTPATQGEAAEKLLRTPAGETSSPSRQVMRRRQRLSTPPDLPPGMFGIVSGGKGGKTKPSVTSLAGRVPLAGTHGVEEAIVAVARQAGKYGRGIADYARKVISQATTMKGVLDRNLNEATKKFGTYFFPGPKGKPYRQARDSLTQAEEWHTVASGSYGVGRSHVAVEHPERLGRPVDPHEGELIGFMRKNNKYLWGMAKLFGVKLVNPKTGQEVQRTAEGRPEVPRIPTPSFYQIIRRGAGEWWDIMHEGIRDLNGWTNEKTTETMRSLQAPAVERNVGAIEFQRLIPEVPTHLRNKKGTVVELYETDPLTIMSREAQHGPMRTAYIAFFGQRRARSERPIVKGDPEEGAPRFRDQFRKAGGRVQDFDHLVAMLSQRRPWGDIYSRGEVLGSWKDYTKRIALTGEHVLSGGMLSMAFLQNLMQVSVGSAHSLAGTRALAKGLYKLVTNYRAMSEMMNYQGIVTQTLHDIKPLPGRKIEGVGNIIRRVLDGHRALVDEFNERWAGATGLVLKENIKNNALRWAEADRDRLRILHFTPKEIEALISGKASDALYTEIPRRFVKQTQYTTLTQAEKSFIANSPALNLFFRFHQYAQGETRLFDRHLVNFVDAIRSGNGERMAASTLRMARFLVHGQAVGAANLMLMSLVAGKSIDRSDESWGDWILNNTASWIGGPPLAAIRMIAGDASTMSLYDQVSNVSPYLRQSAQAYDALVGEGRFRDLSVGERAAEWARGLYPLSRMQGGFMALMGLQDPEMVKAQEVYRKYVWETEGRHTHRGGDEDPAKSKFAKHMVRGERYMTNGRTEDAMAEIGLATQETGRGRKEVEQSLAARKWVPSDEAEQDKMQAAVGSHYFTKFQDHDKLLDLLKHAGNHEAVKIEALIRPLARLHKQHLDDEKIPDVNDYAKRTLSLYNSGKKKIGELKKKHDDETDPGKLKKLAEQIKAEYHRLLLNIEPRMKPKEKPGV
ncbi:MAG: hypothetical protein V1929_09170 [bacterium]